MVIYNDVMYYHQGDDSNSVYRIDVANFQELSNIDAGIQLDDNSGPASVSYTHLRAHET